MSLFLGKVDDKEVFIEPFHTLFAGQTNLSGKTTAIRALMPEALKEGYTILAFDTKPTVRELSGYRDVPVCYQPTTDPLVLIGLLEGIFKRRLTQYYGTLMRLVDNVSSNQDIIQNAIQMEKTAKGGFVKDACLTLKDLMMRLDNELKDFHFSEKLEVKIGEINVMPIGKLSMEAQQLVIKTAFEETLKNSFQKFILVIDEAFRFLPQDYSSACKRPVQDVITQGAKTKLFVWLATQFLAPTEKDTLKAMANKLLGRQDHDTEIQHTQKLIPGGRRRFSSDDIMTLKRGEFIFVPLEGTPQKIYVIPPEQREGYKPATPIQEDFSEFIPRLDKLEEILA